jgi:hypothetical protein
MIFILDLDSGNWSNSSLEIDEPTKNINFEKETINKTLKPLKTESYISRIKILLKFLKELSVFLFILFSYLSFIHCNKQKKNF